MEQERAGMPPGADKVIPDEYGPGALEEMTDPAGASQEDLDVLDVANEPIDPQVLRDGGPTRTPGAVTTTGGKAGPASVRRVRPRDDSGKVAPTTTGDATSGGMGTPVGGATRDATTGGDTGGTIVGGSDVDPNRAYNPEEGAGPRDRR